MDKKQIQQEFKKDWNTKTIKINTASQESITKAERIKSALENKGYSLVDTIQKGFNDFILVYA